MWGIELIKVIFHSNLMYEIRQCDRKHAWMPTSLITGILHQIYLPFSMMFEIRQREHISLTACLIFQFHFILRRSVFLSVSAVKLYSVWIKWYRCRAWYVENNSYVTLVDLFQRSKKYLSFFSVLPLIFINDKNMHHFLLSLYNTWIK